METSDLIAAVRQVAIEQPTYVYDPDPDCVYREETGEPSCLIGHALKRIGQLDLISVETRMSPGASIATTRNLMNVSQLLYDLGLQFTEAQKRWLTRVQSQQDERTAWGDAVNNADYEIGPIG